MDFWNIDDSATWQEESWSKTLHESLFESVTPGKHVKEQRAKKKNKCDSQISLTKEKKQKRQSSNEERICEDEAVPRKKKKKGNVKRNHEDDVGSKDEVSAKKEKLLPKISSVSSKTVKHITPPDVDKLVTQDGVTSVGNTENASVQSKSKTKTNKKRKRKPRNNKFKVETKGEEEDERHAICDDFGQSQVSGMKESSVESSEPKLSRKERRKLKKKMAKQQLRTSKQNQAKNEDKKLDDNSETADVSKLSQKTSIDGIELNDEDENEIPNTSSHDDASCNLILATTRRKTQMKRDISLKTQMESQLKSSQFRYLNEQLYKVTGDEAKGMFASDPSAFLTYHEGFTQQVQQWPSNPVDIIIETLKKRPASLVVGDFGCGDAKIARSVKQKVHSFDLYPINKYVTVCDTKKVPLKDGVLDVAVFCLSLMGTNWMDYVKEANRVLKPGGLLKVAEVASRFTSLASFLSVMKSLGFQLKTKDVSNKMFYLFDFKKKQVVTSVPTVNGAILKPCLYKKR